MARTKKTTVKQTDYHEVIDGETGEVLRTERNRKIQWPTEPDYIKVYLSDICYLTNTPKYCSDVLSYLLKYVTYANDEEGGMVINLTSYNRKVIAKNLGFKSLQSITNAISNLIKGKVLFRLGGGTYQLNPYLFGKGDWKDIKKLRTTITWDGKGKTIQTEIEHFDRKNMKRKSIHIEQE